MTHAPFVSAAPGGPMARLMAPAGRATAGVFAALFLAIGAHMPFWPVWLADWGLAEAEIGAYLGLAILARIAAGVAAPWLADMLGARRWALALLGALGAAAFLAHAVVETRPALFALTLLTAVAISGSIPISDALASAASERFGFAYAHVRALGSAAFLAGNLGAGAAVWLLGPQAALWWCALSMAGLAALALRHPGGVKTGEPKPRLRDAAALLRARPFLLAAAAHAALQAAHGPLYAYGSIHWRAQGLSEATVGALWAAGVAAEVATMLAVGGWMAARLGPWGCFALAGSAGLLRWTALALEPSLAALWALQLLHALTFAPAHLGVIAFIAAAAPSGLRAGAQGLLGPGAGGAAMALITLLSAVIYPALGAWAFGLGALMSAGGLVAALALRRAWNGGRVVA